MVSGIMYVYVDGAYSPACRAIGSFRCQIDLRAIQQLP